MPVDPQLFQSGGCQISCWNNIVVGKTNVADLRKNLQSQYRHVEENESHVWSQAGDWRIFDTQTDDRMQIHIDTKGGFVSQIALTANAFSLSLNDVVNHFGKTNYVLLYYYPEMTGSILGETMTVHHSQITFFYPDSGYVLSTSLPASLSGHTVKICISGDEFINHIEIIAAGTIDQMMAQQLDNPPTGIGSVSTDDWQNYMLKRLKPLASFGCLTMPYASRPDMFMQTW